MFLATLFLKLGAGERLAKVLSIVTILALALFAIWWLRHDAYGDGVRATDAKWEEAGRRLERQAETAADDADANSAERVEEFTNQLTEEAQEIEDAQSNGSSPLDVLFGG